jgi:hypothetical protein
LDPQELREPQVLPERQEALVPLVLREIREQLELLVQLEPRVLPERQVRRAIKVFRAFRVFKV